MIAVHRPVLRLDTDGRRVPLDPAGKTMIAPDARLYVIGDIHGRLDLLERMIELVNLDIKETAATVSSLRSETMSIVGPIHAASSIAC